jgi:hypothetical protein
MSHPKIVQLTPATRSESLEIGRRRRVRNWAMLVVLVALAALFYAITVVKMLKG